MSPDSCPVDCENTRFAMMYKIGKEKAAITKKKKKKDRPKPPLIHSLIIPSCKSQQCQELLFPSYDI